MKPIFKIIADDKDITTLIENRLISLDINDETGLLSDRIEIILDNRDDILDIPNRGANLKISLGYENDYLLFIGSFIVDNIIISSPANIMKIIAKSNYAIDRNITNNIREAKNRSFHNCNLDYIINQIANNYNLVLKIDDYYKNIFITHLDQINQSDLTFLVNLSIDYDAIIKFISNNLIFVKKPGYFYQTPKSVTGKKLDSIKITKEEISNWRLNILDREKYSKVIAKYYDLANAKEEKIEVGDSDSVSNSDSNSNSNPNNSSSTYYMKHIYSSKEKALSIAKSKLEQIKRGITKIDISMIGNPKLFVAMKIILSDNRYIQDKEFIIENVNHNLSSSRFISNITASQIG